MVYDVGAETKIEELLSSIIKDPQNAQNHIQQTRQILAKSFKVYSGDNFEQNAERIAAKFKVYEQIVGCFEEILTKCIPGSLEDIKYLKEEKEKLEENYELIKEEKKNLLTKINGLETQIEQFEASQRIFKNI